MKEHGEGGKWRGREMEREEGKWRGREGGKELDEDRGRGGNGRSRDISHTRRLVYNSLV